jgi:hypothetical protein
MDLQDGAFPSVHTSRGYPVPLSRLSAISLAYLIVSVAFAQSAPTNNVLSRMSIVKSNYGTGTAFSIDVDGREYWITAKHVLTGAKRPPYGTITTKKATLQILDPAAKNERWIPVNFSVLDVGKDIDIVVLAPPIPLLPNPLPSVKTTIAGVVLGGECEFLGFPSATGSAWSASFEEGKSYWMPYVKHCFISSLPGLATRVLILDGLNNPGFSGGPVIYRTGSEQQIIGVISSIVTEPSEVISSLATSKSVSRDRLPPKDRTHTVPTDREAFSPTPRLDALLP